MKVTTHQLSRDGATVDPASDQIDHGEMTAAELAALLTRFTSIDAIQNQYGDPHVIVRVRDEAHLIRTNRGRLHLYNARDVSQPSSPFELPALMALLEGSPAFAAASVLAAFPDLDVIAPQRKHNGMLAVAILVVGLGLNLWALAQYLMRAHDLPPPECAPITDLTQLSELRRRVPGVYATGSDAGSRIMRIKPEGGIEFSLLARDPAGALHQIRKFTETFVWSRRRVGTLCLVTSSRGQVEIGADTDLRHFGDTYRRIAAGK
jgi:hypothetical protein